MTFRSDSFGGVWTAGTGYDLPLYRTARLARRERERYSRECVVIILGIVLLVIGFVAKIAILWTVGIVILLIGAALAVAGAVGRSIGGRRHYY